MKILKTTIRNTLNSFKNVIRLLTQPSLRKAINYNSKARSLLAEAKFDEAINAAESAISFMPKFAEAYYILAQCLLNKDELSSAAINIQLAIDLAPNYAEAHFLHGKILYNLKQLDDAIISFEKALSINAYYVEAINSLAIIKEISGNFHEAEKLYRRAISLNPNYLEPHHNLGFLLRKMKRPDEAAASFKIAYDLVEPHFVLHQPASKIGQIFHIAKRYFRAFIDIFRWEITGKVGPKAWLNYQLLNQATNGVSSDHFHNLLKKLPGKSNELPSSLRKSHIFPWVNSNDLDKILEALDRDGLYIFDQLISSDLIDEIHQYATTKKAKLRAPYVNNTIREAVYDSTSPLAAGYDFEESDLIQNEIFQKFMCDPLLLAIAQKYLGVEPKLKAIYLWWNAVFSNNPASNMSQLYHNDISSIRFLKIFVYITDVTEGAGAHSFVIGSHKSNEESRELRRRGVVQISDEDVIGTYGSERVVNITGPRGTVFIADTRGFHKAQVSQSDHRLVLLLYLVNSLYPCNKFDGKRKLLPKESTLIETIKLQPKIFAGYDVL